ncbi:MAG: imidazole glycerol phosphate synthase subunit HisH [Alphaproteobacteria bacterium]|nr:MAG: imidazole glycerol phosphate synthase subunit HisH [Alphaproteobacteria bacterium]
MTERIAVIDCGSGNLRSVAKALERAAGMARRRCEVRVTASVQEVRDADRIVLPGVGAFAACRAGLRRVDGLWQALHEAMTSRPRPLLGICVGMQLLASRGREHGDHAGFDRIPGEVVPLSPADPACKVPHMGWNALALTDAGRAHALFTGLRDGDHVYFVHSYHMMPRNEDDCLARTDHGGPVTAAVGRDLVVGVQFHPEKSQQTGLRLLRNFLEWTHE